MAAEPSPAAEPLTKQVGVGSVAFRLAQPPGQLAVALEVQGRDERWVEVACWSGPGADRKARAALDTIRRAAGLPAPRSTLRRGVRS